MYTKIVGTMHTINPRCYGHNGGWLWKYMMYGPITTATSHRYRDRSNATGMDRIWICFENWIIQSEKMIVWFFYAHVNTSSTQNSWKWVLYYPRSSILICGNSEFFRSATLTSRRRSLPCWTMIMAVGCVAHVQNIMICPISVLLAFAWQIFSSCLYHCVVKMREMNGKFYVWNLSVFFLSFFSQKLIAFLIGYNNTVLCMLKKLCKTG